MSESNYFVIPFGTSMRDSKHLLCLQAVSAAGSKAQGAKLLGMSRSALYKCLAIKPAKTKKTDPNQRLMFEDRGA